MSQQHKYQEINNVFNAFYDVIINAYNTNNSKKIQYELNFIGTLFSNLISLQLHSCNFSISNIANTLIMINPNNTTNLNCIKSDIHYIATYFQDEAVNDIYNEIVKAITESDYIVTKDLVINNFNLEKYKDRFTNLYDYNMICKQILPQFYNISLNKILIKIYSIYDSNYDEYIVKNKEFDKLMNLYNDFTQRNGLYYRISFNFNIQPINYYNFIISPSLRDDNFTYDKYIEFYNLLNSYLRSLININKIKNKPINKQILNEKKSCSKQKSDNSKQVTTEKKPKKKTIPVALKRNVWNKWIGEDIGKTKCLCCKLTEITMLNFVCGHIIAEANGGELKLDNLKPICVSCNSSMGVQNMNEYIQKYGL